MGSMLRRTARSTSSSSVDPTETMSPPPRPSSHKDSHAASAPKGSPGSTR